MHYLSGTFRDNTPQETLQKVYLYLKNFGITRVADITHLDVLGIPTYIAMRPNAKGLSVSQGKGLTKELAKISALMESIERWHAENIQLPAIVGSFKQLKPNYHLLNPTLIANELFDTSHLLYEELIWIPAIEAITKKFIYIPKSAISLDSTQANHLSLKFNASSNGLAAGNTQDEAIFHAICELVERHSYYYWLQAHERNILNLSSIPYSIVTSLIANIQTQGFMLDIFLMPNEFGLPAYVACLYKNDHHDKRVFAGKGAHIDDEIAMIRAITEAAQSRLTVISGARDDLNETYFNLPNTPISLEKNAIPFTQSSPPCSLASFAEVNHELITKIQKHGYEQVILCDLTQHHYNISVTKALIPGLKHVSQRN
ncbi:MAG: YcaO-like family protein [Legionellales bacterium]|nr:YcaO-like family protein [Legionellales bacterium]